MRPRSQQVFAERPGTRSAACQRSAAGLGHRVADQPSVGMQSRRCSYLRSAASRAPAAGASGRVGLDVFHLGGILGNGAVGVLHDRGGQGSDRGFDRPSRKPSGGHPHPRFGRAAWPPTLAAVGRDSRCQAPRGWRRMAVSISMMARRMRMARMRRRGSATWGVRTTPWRLARQLPSDDEDPAVRQIQRPYRRI